MLRLTPYALACLIALVFTGCDSAGSEDLSPLLHGTWARVDAGATGEAVRFQSDQSYEMLSDGEVVETGVFATMDGKEGNTFGVRFFTEKGRGDETAELIDDTLLLHPGSGEPRTYERQ